MSQEKESFLSFNNIGGAVKTTAGVYTYAAMKTAEFDYNAVRWVAGLYPPPNKTSASTTPEKPYVFARSVLNAVAIGAMFIPGGPLLSAGIAAGTAFADEYLKHGEIGKVNAFKVLTSAASSFVLSKLFVFKNVPGLLNPKWGDKLVSKFSANADKLAQGLEKWVGKGLSGSLKIAAWPIYAPYKLLQYGLSKFSTGAATKFASASSNYHGIINWLSGSASKGVLAGGTYGFVNTFVPGLTEIRGSHFCEDSANLISESLGAGVNGSVIGAVSAGGIASIGGLKLAGGFRVPGMPAMPAMPAFLGGFNTLPLPAKIAIGSGTAGATMIGGAAAYHALFGEKVPVETTPTPSTDPKTADPAKSSVLLLNQKTPLAKVG